MMIGSRITLSALQKDDSATLFTWINDPDVVRFSAPYAPVHEPNHTAWFERVTADAARVVFAIRDRVSLRLIGVVQLIELQPIHRSAELVIRIGSQADRGRGIGTEALSLAVDFGFRHRNLQRIALKVFADNPRAIRAYEKVGFQREGLLRRAVFIDGAWRDEVVMAMLSDDA